MRSSPIQRPVSKRLNPLLEITAAALLCTATLLATPALGYAKAPALKPGQAALVSSGGTVTRDRLLPGHAIRSSHPHAALSSRCPTGTVVQNGVRWKGGLYAVSSSGSPVSVCVYTSAAFTYSAAVNSDWATFFASLPHGSEITQLTVYIAPISQITAGYLCGPMADSCYDPGLGAMYLTGETPPDGANIQQIAAHEYGHHIASWRLNTPWDALNNGPKHWATSAAVCDQTRKKKMFPGDEGAHYEDNPSEIWAETYRVYATSVIGTVLDPWEILSPQWEPVAANLTAAAADTLRPWLKQQKKTLTGHLGSSGSQKYVTSIPFPLDGRLDATGSVKSSLRIKVAVQSSSGAYLTASSSLSSRASVNVCSSPTAKVTVTRLSGSGTWTLQLQSPGS